MALTALFFSCLAASALTCFCTACLCVAFGDLSPMTRRVRSMATGVNRRPVRFLLRQLLPRHPGRKSQRSFAETSLILNTQKTEQVAREQQNALLMKHQLQSVSQPTDFLRREEGDLSRVLDRPLPLDFRRDNESAELSRIARTGDGGTFEDQTERQKNRRARTCFLRLSAIMKSR